MREKSKAPPSPSGKGPTSRRTAIGATVVAGVAVLAFGAWYARRGTEVAAGAPALASAASNSPTVSPLDTAATAMLARCTTAGAVNQPCLENALQSTLKASGQRTAFAVLVRMRASPALAGKDHGLAHQLGRFAFQAAGNPSVALADCPGDMGSGCLHGVVEGYFLANGPNASIVSLCTGNAGASPNAVHQCWHGVGHGLFMTNGYDWKRAVVQCGTIAEPMDRVNCSSGVFMQSGMDDGASSMGSMPGMDMAEDKHPKSDSRARADNLLYPCNTLDNREVAIGCWQMQPFSVLKVTGGSFERAFWACSQSGPYRIMCEEGIGQAAGAQSRIDSRGALTYCDAAPHQTTPWRNCMIGAIKDIVVQAHSIAPGVTVCRLATADYAHDCFAAIGVINRGMEPSPGIRVQMCSGVPDAYRMACAGLADASPAATERSSPPTRPAAPSARPPA